MAPKDQHQGRHTTTVLIMLIQFSFVRYAKVILTTKWWGDDVHHCTVLPTSPTPVSLLLYCNLSYTQPMGKQ